ncbi:hypothetical protein [Gordonia sp. SMJS1]|uniref:hypothetical protein n=1 Tax=Gordonia sp. SMJS1 TaxID=3039400 RepID=UPI002456BC9A|nr:hypothetical protein [Gordonia sp. SMJS1]WGJ88205.1 hypothetical protein QAD21_24785 [Gordonia sp. SMJS1]
MTTTASDERLNELADLATACRDAFLAVSNESHWRPGLSARPRVEAINRADPAASTDDIMAGADLVSEVLVSYLEIAANHLASIGTLIRAGEVMFSPPTLARAVMENCARVIWVIGRTGDPIDVLARAYLEEFHSCEYQKAAAQRLGGDSKATPEYVAARTRWTTVRDRAIAAFPDTTKPDLAEDAGGRTLATHTLPSPSKGVADMFSFLRDHAGATITDSVAEGVYHYLSSHTHPSLYPIRQLRRYTDHGDHAGTELHLETESIERLVGAAVSTFYSALGYAMSFYDLPRGPHDILTAHIESALPQLFNQP